MKLRIYIILISISLSGCSFPIRNGVFSIEQGITGQVLWKEGNHMPSPGGRFTAITKPVEKEIVVYEMTNKSQAKAFGPFFSDIKTALIAKVKSTKTGFFQVELPVGTYSVFSVEPGGLFANSFDGKGNIQLVEVTKGAKIHIDFAIDYMASY